MGSPGAESRAGQVFVGWPVIVDREQVRGVALPAASSPLRRCARTDAPRRQGRREVETEIDWWPGGTPGKGQERTWRREWASRNNTYTI